MNVAVRKSWTQEAFFAGAEAQGERYEFDGNQPVAMTGGSAGHSRLMRRLHRALDSRLVNGPCEPLGPDAGVETTNKAVRYPDALISCSHFENRDHLIPGVVVVFEIVNPSSARVDRIVKVREFAAVPSIRRDVILESSIIGITVLDRDTAEDPWRAFTLTGDDALRMPEIGIEIPVAEFYDGIVLADQEGSA
jgi:Uma2 family endonuclease